MTEGATTETFPIGSSTADEQLSLVHNLVDRFYTLSVDGAEAGLLVYEVSGTRRVFTHVYMHDGYRGRGLVTPFIAATFDDIRRHELTVTNYCPVIGHFVAGHPAYEDVLDTEARGNW